MSTKGWAMVALVIIIASWASALVGLGGIDSGSGGSPITLVTIGSFAGLILYAASLYTLRKNSSNAPGYTFPVVVAFSIACWIILPMTGATEPGSPSPGSFITSLTAWSLLSLFVVPIWGVVEIFRTALKA
jgi:hypothetical protein